MLMNDTVLVALFSLVGTLVGSLAGIITSNKLIQYRMDKLEESVNQIKTSQDRINDLETHNQVQDEKIRNLERRIGEYANG